jgi:hypothetical protein
MTIEERLERIERQNVYLRVGLGLVLLAGVALLVMGQAAPSGTVDEVRARRFALVDENGTERASLQAGKDDLLFLITDALGHHRVLLQMTRDSTRLAFVGNNQKPQVALSLVEGVPTFRLFDAQGTVRAVLGGTSLETVRTGVIEQRPESSLVLFDKDGKLIWRAP